MKIFLNINFGRKPPDCEELIEMYQHLLRRKIGNWIFFRPEHAFNMVNHGIHMTKLEFYGISGIYLTSTLF